MGEERVTPASGLSSGEDPAEPVATDPIPVRLDEMARQIADLRSRLELHSELASTPPKESSYLLGTILDLKETIGRLDERIDNQGKMLSERIDNQGKMLSERIENQGKTLSDLSGHVVGLESKLDEQVWALRNVMLSKVQFWMGIGLLITVILGLAGIYLSTMPKP
jgi:chromosome segregation ATPase